MSSPLKQGNYRAAPQQRRPHRDRDGSWSDAATVLLPWSLAALVCLSCSFIVYSYRSSYISAYDSYNRGESEKKDFSRSLETLREAVTLVKDRDELFGEDDDDDANLSDDVLDDDDDDFETLFCGYSSDDNTIVFMEEGLDLLVADRNVYLASDEEYEDSDSDDYDDDDEDIYLAANDDLFTPVETEAV